MDLSIVILNYKTKNLVKECLRGIKMVAPKLNYELIVVDNASSDGIQVMLVGEFADVRFISSSANIGFAAGNNLGISEAKGRYIMIMNPDIAVFSNSLEILVSFMDANPQVGIAGPKLLNPDRSVQFSAYRFPKKLTPIYRRTLLGKLPTGVRELDRYLINDWDRAFPKEIDWLLGACLIVRRSAAQEVGLLDERFFLYFEDTDWCRRFWEKKWKVLYVPASVMVHFHRRESADAPLLESLLYKSTRAHIASSIKYFFKYRGKSNPRQG